MHLCVSLTRYLKSGPDPPGTTTRAARTRAWTPGSWVVKDGVIRTCYATTLWCPNTDDPEVLRTCAPHPISDRSDANSVRATHGRMADASPERCKSCRSPRCGPGRFRHLRHLRRLRRLRGDLCSGLAAPQERLNQEPYRAYVARAFPDRTVLSRLVGMSSPVSATSGLRSAPPRCSPSKPLQRRSPSSRRPPSGEGIA